MNEKKLGRSIATLCAAFLLIATYIPVAGLQGASEYDPWVDINDDGVIDVADLTQLARLYGTSGTSINKTEMLLHLNVTTSVLRQRVDDLNVTVIALQEQVAGLEAQVANLRIDVESLNASLLFLQGQIVTLQAELGALHTYVDSIYTRVTALESNVAMLESEIAALKSDVAVLRTEFTALETDFVALEARVDMLETTVVNLVVRVEALENQSGFTYAPAYDSGWLDITNKCGQHITLVHNLSTMDVTVDITGRTAILTEENWHRFWSMGDVNRDGYINDADGDLLEAAFMSRPGDPNWNPDADLNQDLVVDLFDLTIWASHHSLDIWTYFVAGTHQRHLDLTSYTLGWRRSYGADLEIYYASHGEGVAVVQTYDEGYAVAGTYYRGPSYDFDFWLIKTDSDGDMEWNMTYDLGTQDRAMSMVQTSDGGYAIAGTVYDGVDKDFWLVKTTRFGTKQWGITYDSGYQYDDYAESIVQTSDGYVIAGYTYMPAPQGAQTFLVKTNAQGVRQPWVDFPLLSSSVTGENTGKCVIQTSDGRYAIAGSTDTDAFLLKLHSNGATQWLRTYGEGRSSCVVQTGDAGYAIAGWTSSFGGGDAWLIKTNSNGFMEWNKNYGGPNSDYARSVVQTEEGGYALAGTHMWRNWAHCEDLLLVKTDSYGNMQWNKTWDWGLSDYGNSVIQTNDGGYAIAGTAYETWGAVLVKTGVESGLAWTDSTVNTITLYRGATDVYWNYVRVRIWKIKEIP